MATKSTQRSVGNLQDLLDQLDRLEELIEEMDDLGVFSRDAAEQRIVELDEQIEQLSPNSWGNT